MTRVEKVAAKLQGDLQDKAVLEVACGCGEFSIAASKMAQTVCCVDLDSFRLRPEAGEIENLHFEIMDATAMTYPDASFDTVVMYNAVGHLAHILPEILDECLRVLHQGGAVYFISSFKMDKTVIHEKLIPLLKDKNILFSVDESMFIYVKVQK